MACTIKYCKSCKPHPYQDKKYGKKKRVMNISQDGKRASCTVCGEKHNVG